MTTLIPDFARLIAESNRRTTLHVQAEIAGAEQLREQVETTHELGPDMDTLRRRVARQARSVTRELLAVIPEHEELWSSVISSLGTKPSPDVQIQLLHAAKDCAESASDCLSTIARLWNLVERLGGTVEEASKLDQAGAILKKISAEASRALAVRIKRWQPADPSALDRAMSESAQRKPLSQKEAKAYFRQKTA